MIPVMVSPRFFSIVIKRISLSGCNKKGCGADNGTKRERIELHDSNTCKEVSDLRLAQNFTAEEIPARPIVMACGVNCKRLAECTARRTPTSGFNRFNSESDG